MPEGVGFFVTDSIISHLRGFQTALVWTTSPQTALRLSGDKRMAYLRYAFNC